MNQSHDHNRRAWDERARRRQDHARSATLKDFQNPLAVIDECGWLGGNVTGRRVLCLAAGGGKQSVLFAAAGAQVTVVDISPQMLALDRQVAAERGLKVEVIEASMDNLSMIAAASFDIVIQPVSTCYVPDVRAVYRQVARVTAPGGLYISQHKQPVSQQADVAPSARGYALNEPYFRSGPLPLVVGEHLHRESGTIEFLHRWEDLIGGLCRSGFVVEDLIEPRHHDPKAETGTFAHRCCYVPPFVTIKARRGSKSGEEQALRKIWAP